MTWQHGRFANLLLGPGSSLAPLARPGHAVSPRLCHRGKAAFEVGDQVARILEPDVEAQGGPARRPARRGAVAAAVEQDDEALVSAPGKSHPEQLERVEEGVHGGVAGRLEDDAE